MNQTVQLSGSYATTKIIDFVKFLELQDFEGDARDFSPEKYKIHCVTNIYIVILNTSEN